MITDQLEDLVRSALHDGDDMGDDVIVRFERPRRKEHGDWSSNVALEVGRGKRNPRALAEEIVSRLPPSPLIERVDIAGPGFLNFYLAPAWLHDVVRRAADNPDTFGRATTGAGTAVNVEYVSANPTGPINVVSGRHAAVGDTIANLLEATGHSVTREYYINDTGTQIRLFARSVAVRLLQEAGRQVEMPEDGYQGDYIADLAREIADELPADYLDKSIEGLTDLVSGPSVSRIIQSLKSTLERFGTTYDVWFAESSLHADAIQKVLKRLEEGGTVETRDAAMWLETSRFGDDKDRVLVRSNGEPTYLAKDAAYLMDKFDRGFERLLYLWGSDHHGAVNRLIAAARALGYPADNIEVLLMQKVSLSGRTGSKRAGIYVRLDDLIDEVGVDAARYTFLTRSIDATLDFDIDLVKEQAPENPVYYVQYAHARICSILRKAESEGATTTAGASLDALAHESELQLMRKLAAYEETIPEAARQRAPQKVARYAEELASDFSAFYRDCKVVSDDRELTAARLLVCIATRNVIAQALGMLGVSAPERM